MADAQRLQVGAVQASRVMQPNKRHNVVDLGRQDAPAFCFAHVTEEIRGLTEKPVTQRTPIAPVAARFRRATTAIVVARMFLAAPVWHQF